MMMVTFDFMYVHRTLRVSGPYHLVAALRPEFLWAMTIVWPDFLAVVFPQQIAVRLFLYVTHLNCD